MGVIRKSGKATKIFRSAEQWQSILANYEKSGLTQEAFCKRESLAGSTFSKWRNRLSKSNPSEPTQPMFIDLSSLPDQTACSGWDIELTLGDGVTFRFRQSQ